MTFRPYISAFDARALPRELRKRVSLEIVPPLVGSLQADGFEPMVGHDLGRLVAMHEASGGRMKLIPLSDPTCQPDADERNTVVLIIERDGRDVACAGVRLLWVENSLAEEMLPLFFAANSTREPEAMIVTAPRAHEIKACHVAFSVSFFADRLETNGLVTKAMSRLLHLWALAHFRWSHLVAIAERAQARLLAWDTHGFAAIEQGVWRNGREYLLLHAPRQHYRAITLTPTFTDLARPLGDFGGGAT